MRRVSRYRLLRLQSVVISYSDYTSLTYCVAQVMTEPYALQEFCTKNPKPCPLLSVGRRGQAVFPQLGEHVDLRSDISKYYIYRYGELEEVWQRKHRWRLQPIQ